MQSHLRLLVVVTLGLMPILGSGQMPAWREKGWCSYHYPPGRPPPPRINLPGWACEDTYKRKLQQTYVPYTGINPFFISGDFDSNGRSDIAIWVTDRKKKKRGILFLMQGRTEYFVAGAGRDAQERGNDYTYVDAWSLISKGELLESTHEDGKVQLLGDAIVAEKTESAAFAIYWDGKGFKFYQLTD